MQFYNKNADIYEDHMFSKGYTGHIQAAEALHRNCNGDDPFRYVPCLIGSYPVILRLAVTVVTDFVSGDSGLKVLDVGGGSGLVVQAVSGAYSSRFLSVLCRYSDYPNSFALMSRYVYFLSPIRSCSLFISTRDPQFQVQ